MVDILKSAVGKKKTDVIKQYAGGLRMAGGQVLAFAAGLLLSGTSIFGNYAPFGTAFTAAMPKGYVLSAGFGAVIGYLFRWQGGDPFRYIAAVCAAMTVKFFLSGLIKSIRKPLFSSITAFLSVFVTGMAVASINSFAPSDIIMYTAESLMAAGCAYFIHRATATLSGRRGVRGMSQQELVSIVITLALIMLSLSDIKFAGVSPARIIVVICIMAAAKYGRETGGAIAGIAMGFAMSLANGEYSFLAGAYSFGGLIAGVFSPLGKIGCAAAFVLANGVISLRVGATPEVISGLYEVLAASVVFIALPSRVTVKMSEFFSPSAKIHKDDGLRRALCMRLSFASNALTDVSQTVEEVSARLQRVNAPDAQSIYSRVESEACKNCALRLYCWETVQGETLDALMEMCGIIRRHGRIVPEEIPDKFGKRCARIEEVCQSLFTNYSDYSMKESAMHRIEEVRSVVSDQFDGIAEMLAEMSYEFENAERFDSAAAARIDSALCSLGIVASSISCTIDKDENMTVEFKCEDDGSRINKSDLIQELSSACDRQLDLPCISVAEGETIVTLSERANYHIEFGAAQFTCSDARMCGDAYDFFNDGHGRAFMLISDGMGAGGRAAVDSAMASGLMSRLIKAGFGLDCALKIVNSAMLFKSVDESTATMDISQIDLFSGKVDMYKAGAVSTIIKRNGRTGKAECKSLPIGILRDVGFDHAVITLSPGDIVLMMSDGVTSEGTDWICAELEAWREDSSQRLAEHIASGARRRRSDGHEDDITVIAAIIEKAF